LPGGQAEISQIGVNKVGVIDKRMPTRQGSVRRLAGKAHGDVKSGLIRISLLIGADRQNAGTQQLL